MKKKSCWALLPAGIVAADQLVKYWAQTVLQERGTLPLWRGVFHLTYARNTGAAFSILRGARWMFIPMTLLLIALLLLALDRKWVRGWFGTMSVLFIVGGGIGNLIDRVWRSYVIDLFDFRLIHFAVFNVADIFITLGGIFLCIYVIFIDPRLAKQAGERTDGTEQHDQRDA